MIRVLVVDDHPVMRVGLRTVLEALGDIRVVAEAADGEEAVGQAEALKPDVVLLDCRLPGMDGVAVARTLRERCPGVRVVALSAYDDGRLLWGMMQAGAAGYVLKEEPPERVVAVIRAAVPGEAGFRPQQVAKARRWWEGIGEKSVPARLYRPSRRRRTSMP